MADTRHAHGPSAPVEADGISYSGIVWFVVILAGVTIACQLLMWLLFVVMQGQAAKSAAARSPLAPMAAPRPQEAGRVYPDMVSVGTPSGPAPQLLVREPVNLETHRAHEQQVLTTYDWVDKNAGTIRIPIDQAKDMLIKQGLPTRGSGK
jgi:hypothetical protein